MENTRGVHHVERAFAQAWAVQISFDEEYARKLELLRCLGGEL